jgi:hypothetical protein
MHLIALMIGVAFQTPAPASVAVLSECDASSDVVAQAPRDAALEVHYSIAGAPTCYLVTGTLQGKPVRGFVLDRQVDSVVAFEKSRVQTEQTAFKAPPVIEAPAPPPADPVKTTDSAKTAAVVTAKAPEEKKPAPKHPKVDM